VSAALLNIVIGLVTSVLSGTAVLVWRRAASSRVLHRKAAFFGLRPGRRCLIVMNNHWQLPGSASHDDVHVMLEIAALAHEAGCPITVTSSDAYGSDAAELAADVTSAAFTAPKHPPAAHRAQAAPRTPDLGQGHGDGVQREANAGPDHGAVDPDELQVAPE
jgi:hypothetical protein